MTMAYLRRLAEIDERRAGRPVLMELRKTGLLPDTVAALGPRIAGSETSSRLVMTT